ncbi:MAG: helix-turn-helix transcriptional regulator [Candidatus Aadella gelida]|nr:helix-turn-helix transcriptional regulator [Candidatus Aadella gelida]
MNEKNLNLIVARLKKGLKQWELARDIGLHHTEYSMYENSRRIPNRDTQLKIAARLGVALEEIFEGGDSK